MKQGDLASVFLVINTIALSAISARAQDMNYKVGDRIEVDTIQSSDPKNAKYKKATIVEVDLKDKCYIVDIDPLPNKLPERMRVMVRSYGPHWVRAVQGADAGAPNLQIDKLQVDQNGTVLADRELLDCEHLEQPRARNGQPLPAALAKKLIRCKLEKPSEPRSDGARTMDISEFSIRAPRRWNPSEDTAFAGTPDSLVYPVRVKWTQKTFYRTYDEVIEDKEQMFTCYVEMDKWYCGYSTVIKQGEKKRIQVKKE